MRANPAVLGPYQSPVTPKCVHTNFQQVYLDWAHRFVMLGIRAQEAIKLRSTLGQKACRDDDFSREEPIFQGISARPGLTKVCAKRRIVLCEIS